MRTSPNNKSTATRKPWSRRWFYVGAAVLLLGAASFLWPKRANPASSSSRPANASNLAPIPVVAAKAERGDIGLELTGLGTVTPIYTVTVKTRVDGELKNVLYKEGQRVRRGDLLAELDARPFEAQLLQAQGQLLKDQSVLANARLDLQRYQELAPHNAIPQQQVATQKALVQQYEGAVKTDQGQIASARLNILYCRITAPVTGRVGLRLVDPGNIVHATDENGLLVITQVEPISVIFTIAEDQVPAVLQKIMAGQRLRVTAYDRADQTKLAEGFLTSLDNQIDPTTGTLKLRATFENRAGTLFPNQFVNVRLLVEQKHGITRVPTAAIQRNSNNTYVYLVKPDSTVTVRNVTGGATEGDVSEITSGISPGDVLVMTGVDKLHEGSKVSVQLAADDGQRQAE